MTITPSLHMPPTLNRPGENSLPRMRTFVTLRSPAVLFIDSIDQETRP